MKQYEMIEKALSEHKKLSQVGGASLVSLSIDIYEDAGCEEVESCTAIRIESISWNCGTKKELSYSNFRKDGTLIDSVRAC